MIFGKYNIILVNLGFFEFSGPRSNPFEPMPLYGIEIDSFVI